MSKFFAIVCFALALPTLGQAQTSVIPYSGQLEAGGVQVSDDVQMRFRLFSANPDGADPASAPVWSSAADGAWNTVKVFQGKFHVNLGGEGFRQGAEGIPDSVFDAEQIWMRIEIDNGNNADHVLPSQALHTVPRAVSAKRASNFTVTQTLTAQNVTANETLTVNGVGPHRVNGALEVVDGDVPQRTTITRHGITTPEITATNATITSDLTIRESLIVGFRTKSCVDPVWIRNTYHECSCEQDEVVLGGGTYSNVGQTIRESRPMNSRTWRVSCSNRCSEVNIQCARIQPR